MESNFEAILFSPGFYKQPIFLWLSNLWFYWAKYCSKLILFAFLTASSPCLKHYQAQKFSNVQESTNRAIFLKLYVHTGCSSIDVYHSSFSYLPQTPQLFTQLSIIHEFVSHSPLKAHLGQLIRSTSLQLTAKLNKNKIIIKFVQKKE